MKSRLVLSLLVSACALAAGLFDAAAQLLPADVIFRNGAVYTMNPIEEGKFADLIVLDRNLFEIDLEGN